MMTLIRKFKFDCSHFLPWHEDKCRNLHGHTYTLEVYVKGNLDKNGVIMDFANVLNDEIEQCAEEGFKNYTLIM